MKIFKGETEEKVLGITWNSTTDKLSFKFNIDLSKLTTANASSEVMTKRMLLSQVARFYDPIGFAAAFTIKAKIAMQELWQLGVSWGEDLPLTVKEKWSQLFREMNELNQFNVPRSLLTVDALCEATMLCIFSDASQDAFGTCAYVRQRRPDDSFKVTFIAAKSRVAPLKHLTIPRLELQAAVLASRLAKTIQQESRIRFGDVKFFTDSAIVLAWIQSPSRNFKPFVSARIGKIQSNSDPGQWQHIPGEANVADDVSRGIKVQDLNDRWINGPEFLTLPEELWPGQVTPQPSETDMECRKTVAAVSTNKAENVIDPTKFSSWLRLTRVTARIQRLATKISLRKYGQPGKEGPLTAEELLKAETFWIKKVQEPLQNRLKEDEFKSLSPFTDDNGIIRVGGRADQAIVSYETKHPALLPANHRISLLITQHVHRYGHSGIAATTAKVRRKYWIIKANKLSKTVKSKCVFCKEMAHQTETQVMAALPHYRLAPHTPAFYYTACDYFGPFQVKISRNKRDKYYGVIFTCLNTRAVHLEMATDCSAMEFQQVLRRFFALRGYPAVILSDNGTQMVGTEREMRKMLQDQDALHEFGAEKGIRWIFTTPAAPHQNGCAEALVKSCKNAIKKAIGEQVLTLMELYTCFLEVGNLINQRPIGRIPNDPDDGAYLCPNDMLLGRATPDVPQGPFRETTNPRHRVEFEQKIIESFWKRWYRDVFPRLVPTKKWHTDRRNVKVDDVVVMNDSNAVRGKWQIGRIEEVYPGADGRVRNVRVKTSTGSYRRPITKIAVICPAEGDD